MGKHTPGPWARWPTGVPSGSLNIVGSLEPREALALVYEVNSQANACLMAAAPDLLAALKESVDWLTSFSEWGYDLSIPNGLPHFSDFIERARAAIAKARNEQ